jgi:hypothetical protein
MSGERYRLTWASSLNSSPLKPLGQIIRNLVGSIYGWYSIKSTYFVTDPLTNMADTYDSCFWLVDFSKIFSSETALPNEPKLGRKHLWKVLYKDCSINHHGCHGLFFFLIGRFLKIFYSDTACANRPKLGRKHLWKVLYGNAHSVLIR